VIRPILTISLMSALAACSSHATANGTAPLVARATFTGAAGEVMTSRLIVADSDDERALGLMGRTSLQPNAGMVFVFDAPTEASFWMKDTSIPLSIAFWGGDDRIIGIIEMPRCEHDPCPTYQPGRPYTDALEMNRGWFTRHGIEIGDSVELQLLTE
jgi:uncharacterized membrane protein (UPF0127 family)